MNMSVPDFDRYLPKSVPGWSIEVKPIADSPEMTKIAEGLLRYDAATLRIYRKNNLEIGIFIAFWLPGKIHPQNIDAHTPDVCWVANGWNMNVLPPLPNFTEGTGPEVPLSNVRHFKALGKELEVLYWHVNGTEFRSNHSVDEMLLPRRKLLERQLRNYWNSVTVGSREQLFARLSVNGKASDLVHEEPIRHLLHMIQAALSGNLRADEI
jgi:hypothetical protein